MRVVIIEDETAAAQNLSAILRKVCPDVEIVATIDTVVDSVEFFRTEPQLDLVFMDIHLADGNAFRIFERAKVDCPVIFTTAYDQYALDAFKVSGIDYILKPIKQEDLDRAIAKFSTLTSSARKEYSARTAEMVEHAHPKRILARVRDKIIPIGEEEIAFFYTENEHVNLTTLDGKCYPVDGTLESLMGEFGGEQFFRANRQFIISRDAVVDVSVWFGSRLSVNLKVEIPEKIIVPKARVSEFKQWLKSGQE
jgi:two-component system LytT family response regulator